MKEFLKTTKGKVFFAVAIILLALLLFFGGVTFIGRAADSNNKNTITVEIPSGSGTSYIASILQEKGVIDSATNFKIYAKLKMVDGKLHAGVYELSPSMNMGIIITRMQSGDQGGSSVTIHEGVALKEIAATLEKNGICKPDDFFEQVENGDFDFEFIKYLPKGENRLEGVLYPDTYKFAKGTSAHVVINTMLKTFDKVYQSEFKQQMEEKNLKFLDVITLASIIEEEAALDEDRPLVSSVFYNRLAKGIPLGSDVTVNYATGKIGEEPTKSDLEIDSPYNTRRFPGLPPGPICMPGKASIEAAINPSDTDYYYFVVESADSLKIVFTETYSEHLKAVKKYRDSFN